MLKSMIFRYKLIKIFQVNDNGNKVTIIYHIVLAELKKLGQLKQIKILCWRYVKSLIFESKNDIIKFNLLKIYKNLHLFKFFIYNKWTKMYVHMKHYN